MAGYRPLIFFRSTQLTVLEHCILSIIKKHVILPNRQTRCDTVSLLVSLCMCYVRYYSSYDVIVFLTSILFDEVNDMLLSS